MAQPISQNYCPSPDVCFQRSKQILQPIVRTAIYSIPHVLATAVITTMNPLTGAVIAASTYASYKGAAWTGNQVQHQVVKVGLMVAGFFVGTGLGALIANAVGLPITFAAALLLHVQTAGVVLLGALGITGILLSVAAVVVLSLLATTVLIAIIVKQCKPELYDSIADAITPYKQQMEDLVNVRPRRR